ncbi:ankyrin repeat and IBR domain-containing protein 1-like isoform X1 [Gadus macrocephalus]|uniref:ankyrin repeat and IBR domain-containing protein 1-like isoform X1 n=1 Tax=Gadus macrocephalus TaxID=80720 RepID=UPI0028CBA71B|nr:ankyrin repeat and IBR domain-containing protein 1-like isoform X1 [Gadus macrocephalus]
MGNTATKFRKALVNGDELLSCQLYEGNPQFKEAMDPNTSYGEPYQHNTALHYAARHAMTRLLRSFIFSKDGNPNKRNVHNETALHLLCMGPHILGGEGPLHPRITRPYEDERRRADCLQVILAWTGAKLDQGEYESADINATDNRKNTCLHYAAASGLKTCVEYLVQREADLFAENERRETPCDCAEQHRHTELALSLESQMVFSPAPEAEGIDAEYAALDHRELYEGLQPQDLRRLKDMLIVETADMLQAPLFTAEALLRAHDWDREKLLEAWMTNAEACCQRSGVQMHNPPPTGCNAWDTLPSPRTPRVARCSIPTTPDQICLTPADEDTALCGICMCSMSLFEEPVDMSCGHEFCRVCWEGFLNLKIQEGDAHNIFCPAFDCFQLVPVEVIESVVSREMDRRYLQFDIKAFVENNPAIRWCPRAGCERAVRLNSQETRGSSANPLSFALLRAPAVDCGKGHLFCWECQGEAHEPCDCDVWKLWLQKVSEMRPQELGGVSEAYEDAANSLWMLTNSKACANCKSPIQKNEGCNHMQCAKCKYDFCWICLEEWKKHSSSTGGYYRCTRYEVIQQVEEQSKDMTVEAEKKHKSFQELDRFMHYFTRFKNHEHSYQLEHRLLKTAKDKMEQLSRALCSKEGGPPDTTFIEAAVLELLKTRRILKCSYPYGFFLEPRSTKKEIYELMQTDLEMVTEDLAQKVNRPYLRTPRHRILRAACLVQQKRQEFLASVARGVAPNDSPDAPRRSSFAGGTWDWEYLGFASPESDSENVSEYTEFQYRRRHRQRRRGDMGSLRSNSPDGEDPADPGLGGPEGHGQRRRLADHGSLDDEDPNILLAIQLSLQDSAMPGGWANPPAPAHEASLGAIGTSLPSRLEQSARGLEVLPRSSLSSSELLELASVNISPSQYSAVAVSSSQHHHHHQHQPQQRRFSGSLPFPVASRGGGGGGGGCGGSSTGLFSLSSDTLDSTTCGSHDPSSAAAEAANANLLGNIMAWFHDVNRPGVALESSTSSDTDVDALLPHAAGGGGGGRGGGAGYLEVKRTASAPLSDDAKLREGEERRGVSGGVPGRQTHSERDATAPAAAAIATVTPAVERPTQLDLKGRETSSSGETFDVTDAGRDRTCHVDTPQCSSTSDPLASSSSSEWEEQIHTV